MQLMELIDDKLPEKDASLHCLAILNLIVKFQLNTFSSEKLKIYRQFASSSYLRKDYRLNLVKEYYIAPEYLPLTNGEGIVVSNFGYIPIDKVALKYLKNPSIRKFLKEEPFRERSGKYLSQMDSEQSDRLVGKLKIELFLDDAQLSPTNGLGTGKHHKYLYVYASFTDLPYKYTFHSDDIEMIMMVKRSDLELLSKDFKMVQLFERLKNDLSHLLKFGAQVDGEHFQVTVSFIRGDNAGIYEWTGFPFSFNINAFVCRFCGIKGMCSDCKIKKQANKAVKRLKNKAQPLPSQLTLNCTNCLQGTKGNFALLNNEDFKDFQEAQKHGLTRPFPFETLFDHNLTPANLLPPDSMHDISEGVFVDVIEIDLGIMKYKINREHKKTVPQILTIFQSAINSFPFFEGKPKLKWDSSKSTFKLDGKAIEVN